MEIRDPVHGTLFLSDGETAVIETPEFQRLRAIKQLGFSEFSFPGATHNRFIHSLGVCHIAGMAFDQIFKNFPFSSSRTKAKFRQSLRLAALLHDIGHGPLSHTIEEVMPPLEDLGVTAYRHRAKPVKFNGGSPIIATHEDYTIKYVTDSPLSSVIQSQFADLDPIHIACLIDKTLVCPDDFFFEQGMDFRPLLSQLVSCELDCDRMDYLERDSYFCGTNYGKIDLLWMVSNLTSHLHEEKLYLALNRRALYTFDDFMLSRHHMHLMVYFHHKSIIYEELLSRYLTSPECKFFLPANIVEYTSYNDYRLFEHLANSKNIWAQLIAQRRPYKVLLELHSTQESTRPESIRQALQDKGIDCIWASSKVRLSKYHSSLPEDRAFPIFVTDQYDRWDQPTPIDQSTEIFQRYEGARIIDRLYVAPEKYKDADKILIEQKL